MQRLYILLLAGLLLASTASFAADPKAEPKADEASIWMKRKLEHSQKVFAALAAGDFEQIAASSKSLDTLNTLEKFIRGRNPEYRTQLEIFRYANQQILKQAEAKNLDGATLAFNQLTLSCVNCHRQLRDTK
jgi:hypothetical protein